MCVLIPCRIGARIAEGFFVGVSGMAFKDLKAFAERKLYINGKTNSPIEGILLDAMTRRTEFIFCPDNSAIPNGQGIYIKRQVPVGKYCADFILKSIRYIPGGLKIWPPTLIKTICVECDGYQFHRVTQDQIDHDKCRDEFFLAQGLKTIRLTGWEITNRSSFCVEQILHELGWG